MRAIHYHPSHFISLPVSAAILVFSDESRCELRLKLPQHGSGQDPRTPITLGDPSAAPRGGSGILCHPRVCGSTIAKLEALGA